MSPEITIELSKEDSTLTIGGTVSSKTFEEKLLPKLLESKTDIKRIEFNRCILTGVGLNLPAAEYLRVSFKFCEFESVRLKANGIGHLTFEVCRVIKSRELTYGFSRSHGLVVDVRQPSIVRFNHCVGSVRFKRMPTHMNSKSKEGKGLSNAYIFVSHSGEIRTPDGGNWRERMKHITVCGGNISIDGYDDFIAIANLGRTRHTLNYNAISDRVATGCFTGSLDEFESAVNETYERTIEFEKSLVRPEREGNVNLLITQRRNYFSAIDIMRAARESFECRHKYNEARRKPDVAPRDAMLTHGGVCYQMGVDLVRDDDQSIADGRAVTYRQVEEMEGE